MSSTNPNAVVASRAVQGRFVPGSVTAAVVGNESLIVGAPANNLANTFILTDDPSNPRASNNAQFFAVQDHNNAPIFGIPPAGGPKAFGDYMGVWTGTAVPSVTFTPWDAVQFVGNGAGAFTGPSIYAGVGAPLPASTVTKLGTFVQVANVGDIYIRQDVPQQIYYCTVAGNGGARGGTWTANLNIQGNINANFGNVDCSLAGTGFRAAEGANAKQGIATLVGGTVTVANTSVTANSRIFLTAQTTGAAPGALRVSALTAGTSFVITSSSGTDTSVVAYEIFEPG